MCVFWKTSINKTVALLEESGKRELFWYGVTIGQFGFGVLTSIERQPTPLAPDVANATHKWWCIGGDKGPCNCGAEQTRRAGKASRWADCPKERCHTVDSQGRKWEVMEREDGSVVCYYTREGDSAHWVVWDSPDRRPTPRAADLATGAAEYHRCETCGTLLRVLFRETQNR